MWATADESRDQILALYHRSWELSDATIEELPLDAPGVVPWWHEARRNVTLHTLLVHMVAETNRHAGHVDIVRELIDGARGYRADLGNLPPGDEDWWQQYHDRLQRVAEGFRA